MVQGDCKHAPPRRYTDNVTGPSMRPAQARANQSAERRGFREQHTARSRRRVQEHTMKFVGGVLCAFGTFGPRAPVTAGLSVKPVVHALIRWNDRCCQCPVCEVLIEIP